MAPITKLSALSSYANIISTYNLLKHLIKEDLKEEVFNNLKNRVVELEQSEHNYSFSCYFGTQPDKYIKDLKDKILLIKNRNYDAKILIEDIKTKIHEISSFPLLNHCKSFL